MSRESDEKLLLEFIKWWKGYRAEFCMYPTPDDAPAFLAARPPPATEPT